MTQRFTGKSALVTGAGSGIGQGGQALSIVADVSDPKAMQAAVEQTVREYGALHFAVNNAGVSGVSLPAGELDPAAWRAVTGVNLDGVFYAMRFEIPAILAAGGGAIVNTASVFASRGPPNRSAYTAAKHAVVGLSRAAASEYATRGYRW